jgi:titin
VIFLLLVVLSGVTARAEPAGQAARAVAASASNTVVVTTSSDRVDGTTSSFSSLNANPGADAAISFREALLAANATSTSVLTLTISFNIPTSDSGYSAATKTWTIPVGEIDSSGLPALTRGSLRIEADTMADGPSQRPTIVLDGEQDWDNPANGLVITSANNVVRGLTISNFFDNALVIATSTAVNNQIAGCYIGTDAAGRIAPSNNGNGINISNGAHGNLIGGDVDADRNLIAGNTVNGGVWIHDSTTYSNTVSGNWIGLDATGVAGLGNNNAGVYLSGGTHHNIVGGTSAAEGNVISGNNGVIGAIWIGDAATGYNTVANNWIGVDRTGLAALPNVNADGIYIKDSTHNNLVDNVISANDAGISIRGGAFNTVAGNTIGLAADGKVKPDIGNRDVGIYVIDGAHNNTVGGLTAAARNVISGNGQANTNYGHGIYVSEPQTTNNFIQGNYIGVDASGVMPAGNRGYGVLISNGATGNYVGGASPAARNVIAYNGSGGIWLNSDQNEVANNLVGVGADEKTGLGNQQHGIRVSGNYNTIGPHNLIAHNQHSGIKLSGAYTKVISNELSFNARSGLCVEGGYTQVTDNMISNNGGLAAPAYDCYIEGGVVITGTGDTDVLSNTILYNQGAGITVRAAKDNRISANSISSNDGAGIKLLDGGNDELSPPFNMHATPESVSGLSCAFCTIEIFNDDDDEGEQLLGVTTAGPDGRFAVPIQASALSLAHITATTIDANGNTSPFAAPIVVSSNPPPPVYTIWLPQLRVH